MRTHSLHLDHNFLVFNHKLYNEKFLAIRTAIIEENETVIRSIIDSMKKDLGEARSNPQKLSRYRAYLHSIGCTIDVEKDIASAMLGCSHDLEKILVKVKSGEFYTDVNLLTRLLQYCLNWTSLEYFREAWFEFEPFKWSSNFIESAQAKSPYLENILKGTVGLPEYYNPIGPLLGEEVGDDYVLISPDDALIVLNELSSAEVASGSGVISDAEGELFLDMMKRSVEGEVMVLIYYYW